ncbi:PREDICTED: zinc finger CCCH domain-containing protein 46-like isoform X2 [Camelina sativa]|uniref:Zinc finger CCCH domain-containing protein 46-like isoform X1 n=1 Tax=Camelina sativa TaxID=90675 RepID=A0ABM0TI70_CAMSA|nr:PREDICTED: zinc finger CCCH domain-containing protein 46-like isoform X1 [Camelina sativa]XP_010426778.1 PREDICTED: zinc finger CCCH domain-containing protein 46-like isoform X2 [Camelina sativa]XP_010426779.1 PREDICTED: zinc finger CCCH domain-containing protein 46-like isoform X1 [Camelina sativa]XP_010426780.1 PREDICTED: zinc finger CCCH domain-containing protein 46-like isoform X1 [Camelina sativa]XP_010426781.1 PREDICTED: zinc finger CCCH domain-containing protein 46-like isoform X2 [Ca
MDGYEATRIVLSRIQTLDPENASKIMGLLLLQDHGEKEMIRLAFGPETLVHSVIVKAKKELGLLNGARSPWTHQEELISPKNNRGSSLNPTSLPFYANGGRSSRDLTNDFDLLDDVNPRTDFLGSVHARSGSCVLDGLGYGGDSDLGFGGVPCSYFARGFCKNGASCRFVHSDGGADLVGSPSRIELLRSNSVPPRLAHHFMTRSSLPSFSPKGVNLQQSDAQRAAAALMLGDELQKLGRWRPERIDLSAMACPASRQIYLTFPADSRFREEDVSNYFSTFGPVQDVRIPYQQKRMFGFVTFVYPETVKSILAKGNPHFVCDSRVLVKPYKEKGKVPDKYRTNQTTERELSPTGLDSSPRDVLGGRGFYNNNTQDVLWRSKFEEEILELQSRRLMNLQLLDVKKHFQLNSPTNIHSPNPFSQSLISPRPLSVIKREYEGGEKGKGSSKEGSDDDTMNLPERLEDSLPDSPFASPAHHLLLFADSADNNGSDLWSPSSDNDDNSTPSTLSESFNSFNYQMPRLQPIGMLPGRGGPTCRVGI